MRRLRERRKELPPEQQAEFRSQALKHGQTWRERCVSLLFILNLKNSMRPSHREKLVEKRDKERQKYESCSFLREQALTVLSRAYIDRHNLERSQPEKAIQ